MGSYLSPPPVLPPVASSHLQQIHWALCKRGGITLYFPPPRIKVSRYELERRRAAPSGRVLTTGVIEQTDVVQGDVALSLLGNCGLEDDLRRKWIN